MVVSIRWAASPTSVSSRRTTPCRLSTKHSQLSCISFIRSLRTHSGVMTKDLVAWNAPITRKIPVFGRCWSIMGYIHFGSVYTSSCVSSVQTKGSNTVQITAIVRWYRIQICLYCLSRLCWHCLPWRTVFSKLEWGTLPRQVWYLGMYMIRDEGLSS